MGFCKDQNSSALAEFNRRSHSSDARADHRVIDVINLPRESHSNPSSRAEPMLARASSMKSRSCSRNRKTQVAPSDAFFQHYKVQIIAERPAKSFVTVGEGLCFACQRITSPFIPRDQSLSDIYNGHADSPSTSFFGEPFCGIQQSTA